jgi:hypothetical protein
MSYQTDIVGYVRVHGVLRKDWDKVLEAFASIMDDESYADWFPQETAPEDEYGNVLDAIEDFCLSTQDGMLHIKGTDNRNTRKHELKQLKWIVDEIVKHYPQAKFSGSMVSSGEDVCDLHLITVEMDDEDVWRARQYDVAMERGTLEEEE